MRVLVLPIILLAACGEPDSQTQLDTPPVPRDLFVTISPRADPSRCGERVYAHLKGQPLDMTNTAIPAPSPGIVRYIYPRDLDYLRSETRNHDRLNLKIDANGVIADVYCG